MNRSWGKTWETPRGFPETPETPLKPPMGEGGVAVSDPTHMEVGEKDRKSFQLQQNEAYATQVSYRN